MMHPWLCSYRDPRRLASCLNISSFRIAASLRRWNEAQQLPRERFSPLAGQRPSSLNASDVIVDGRSSTHTRRWRFSGPVTDVLVSGRSLNSSRETEFGASRSLADFYQRCEQHCSRPAAFKNATVRERTLSGHPIFSKAAFASGRVRFCGYVAGHPNRYLPCPRSRAVHRSRTHRTGALTLGSGRQRRCALRVAQREDPPKRVPLP